MTFCAIASLAIKHDKANNPASSFLIDISPPWVPSNSSEIERPFRTVEHGVARCVRGRDPDRDCPRNWGRRGGFRSPIEFQYQPFFAVVPDSGDLVLLARLMGEAGTVVLIDDGRAI